MAEQRAQRRLAAILAADVVGYSRLMREDEAGTLAALKELRAEVIDPVVAQYQGRVVKLMGDGALVEFASVVDAVECALAIQHRVAEQVADLPETRRITFRIGVNLGDIIADGDDIYGDGVNVASRLEAMCEPGEVYLSATAHDQVIGKISASFEDLGEQTLKNMAAPVGVYRVRMRPIRGQGHTPSTKRSEPPLPDKPSIAVLPFDNMSGDLDQEYFADGIVEEIITALSRMRWLFVIARNSSFTYKGRAVDVKQVGTELGVRYLLEGGVRKAGNRVRITAQLIDTGTGANIWADRFDGGLEDIFDLQDSVTESVVGAIAPRLEQAEIERARRKPTESLDAYDLYLRGLLTLYQHPSDKQVNADALGLFVRATELDPEFATAYGMAAWCRVWRKANGWMTDREQEISETERLARCAVTLGVNDAVALARGGHALAFVVGDLSAGFGAIDRALALDPNLAVGWYLSGWARVFLGEPELAIEHLSRAMRLSPLDPLTFAMQTGRAHASFCAGRYEEAALWAHKSLREQPDFMTTYRIAAASNAMAGRLDDAHRAMQRLRELDPELRVSNLELQIPLRRADDLKRYQDGLRIAGLPE